MKKAILWSLIVLAMFIAVSCSENGDDPDPCTCDTLYITDTLYDTLIVVDTIVICDTNYTDLDPPFIKEVVGPGTIIEGGIAAFSCSVFTDSPIISYLWDFFATSAGSEGYFFPAVLEDGSFTPVGTAPYPFVAEDSGYTASYTYDYRGKYNAILQIIDDDGYTEYDGTRTSVGPTAPDSAGPDIIIRAGIPESLLVADFDYKRFGLIADHAIPAAVYVDDLGNLQTFAHVDNDYLPGSKYIQTRAELGRYLLLEGFGDFFCELTWDIDIKGAMHYWGTGGSDIVMYSIYSSMKMDDGLPQTRCIYRKTLYGDGGDQAYYIDENIAVTDSVAIWGMHEYEVWLAVETVQMLSDGAGAAICFDGANGMTTLNELHIYMDK